MATEPALKSAAKYITKELIMPLQQITVARRLMTRNPEITGRGVFNFDKNVLTGLKDAVISYDLPKPDDNRDAVKVKKSTVDIPVISEPFEIPRGDFEAWKNKGVKIDTAASQDAMARVVEREDDLVINGWSPDGTTYEVEGFNNLTGRNQVTTDLDFGTYGNATKAVGAALELFDDSKVRAQGWYLILNRTQARELRTSRSAQGVKELTDVIELLNNDKATGPGQIFSSADQAAGTGAMIPIDTGRRYMELVIPQDIWTVLGLDSRAEDISPVYGTVLEVVYPHFKKPEAVCTLNSI